MNDFPNLYIDEPINGTQRHKSIFKEIYSMLDSK